MPFWQRAAPGLEARDGRRLRPCFRLARSQASRAVQGAKVAPAANDDRRTFLNKVVTVAGPVADSPSSSLRAPDSETDHAARMAKLETELARQIRRQNYLAAVAAERTAQADAMREQLAAVQAQLEARNAELQLALSGTERKAGELQLALSGTERKAGELQLAVSAAERHAQNLQLQIDSLHRSTSWRLTRPLRGIMQWLRRGI